MGFTDSKRQYLAVILALLISFILRMYLSQFEGHWMDIWHFKEWSRAAYLNGFTYFYTSVWSDYPPFYIYILWLVGAVYKLFFSFSFDMNTPVFAILLKIPANAMDITAAFLIFSIVKKYKGFRIAFPTMLFYAFNPAIVYNSAVWGQVDSVFTLFILLTLMFFVSRRPELAGVSMAIAILTKPQSLLLLPLFAILIVKNHKLLKLTKIFVISAAIFIILALPFYFRSSLFLLIKAYGAAYNEYSFTSLNAFNLWAFSGFQKPDSMVFFFLSYRVWSYILFGLLFVYVAYKTVKNEDKKSVYFATAVIFFGFFMLFTRIHERYLFPMFAPLAVIMSLDRRLVPVFWIMTGTFLFNLYYVLQFSYMNLPVPDPNTYILLTAGINIGALVYTIYCFSTFRKNS
ncbi:MAG: hypothetical protein OIN66_17600 [Candidatus Methanoperedens sp.]|nr:hypothetical protein [Candidatus Methanoperedens sp.]